MESIIKAAVERGASDLHIKAGDVFRARIDGELRPLTKQRLTPEQTKAIALKMIPTQADRDRIDHIRDYDCSWGAPGIGRFRVNILRQRSSFMIVLRVIPFEVPTLDKLQLPGVLAQLASADRGIILTTGPAGSGTSSTMAGLINQINTTRQKHILTLEHPIEFLHRDVNSSITQREIGTDTDTFLSAFKAALRQDPDVIMLGELKDVDTLDVAIQAADTGHVVISKLHTPDVTATIARLVAMFPPDEQELARMRLADTLYAVVSQRLIPRADGKGRCPVAEVLVATPAIRAMIKDARKMGGVREALAAGREEFGTQTFDQHLADLVEDGVVTLAVAQAAATNPADVAPLKGGQKRPRSKFRTAAAAEPPRREPRLSQDLSDLLPQ